MIALVVRFEIRDGESAQLFDDLTAAAVAEIEVREPGTLVYATHAVRNAPLSRVFYELYADEAAFRAHEEAPHVIEFHRRKDALLVAEPRVEFCSPGSAKGLPTTFPAT